MISDSAEQKLSSIERSSAPAVQLLDEAANVINLHPGSSNLYVVPTSVVGYQDASRSREQWVLRWLIKQLSTETGSSKTDLVDDARTWSLLHHLIRIIPKGKLRDILAERNFWQILGKCLATAREPYDDTDTNSAQNQVSASDSESGRPTKKRRSSVCQLLHNPLYEQMCDVVIGLTDVLSSTEQTNLSRSSKSLTVYIKADAAALLLGRVLRLYNYAYCLPNLGYKREEISRCIHSYLQLWEQSTWTIEKPTKTTRHDLFNEHVLPYALDGVDIEDRSSKHIKSSLERLVALHFVLPTRDSFLASGNPNKSGRPPRQDDVTQRDAVVEMISKPLHNTASRLCSDSCATLLRTATRIVPRNDIMKRKAESLWLEALFYSLVYMFNHSDFNKDCDHVTFVDDGNDVSSSAQHIGKLLYVLEEAGLEPASGFFQSFVENYLQDIDISLKVLAQISRLSPSIFVPKVDSHGNNLLIEISGCIKGSIGWSQAETDPFVNVLRPIIEATGRARQLHHWIDFWEVQLRETYHFRQVTKEARTSERASCNIWDDPSLFDIFSSVCEQHAPLTLYRSPLEQVRTHIEELPNLVGPAHKHFAKIAMLSAMLKPLSKTASGLALLAEHTATLTAVTTAALDSSNTYQQHRWQLYKLLCKLTEAQPGLHATGQLFEDKFDALQWPNLELAKENSHNNKKTEPEYFLEIIWSFTLLIDLSVIRPEQHNVSFAKALDQIRGLLENLNDCADTLVLDLVWNGAAYDMNSTAKVLSACLPKLATIPSTWVDITEGKELLTSMFRFSVTYEAGTDDSSLSGLLDICLTTILRDTEINVSDLWDNLDTDTQLRHVPASMQRRSVQQMKKPEAQTLLKSVLKALTNDRKDVADARFTGHLEVLQSITGQYPSLVDKSVWDELCKSLDRKYDNADLNTIIIAAQSISKLVNVLVRGDRPAEEKPEIEPEAMLKWTKKQLNTLEPSKMRKLTGRFEILLVLAVVDAVSDTIASGLFQSKVAIEVKTLFEERMPAAISTLPDDNPTVVRCFVAWKIWCTLKVPGEESDKNADLKPALVYLAAGLSSTLDTIANDQPPQNLSCDLSESAVQYLATLATSPERIRASNTSVLLLRSLLNSNEQAESALKDIEEHVAEAWQSPSREIMPGRLKQTIKRVDEMTLLSGHAGKTMEQYLSLTVFLKSANLQSLAKSPPLIAGLGNLASLNSAYEESNITALLLRLDVSHIILQKHSQIINQHIIDSTISSIALLISSASKTTLTSDEHDPRPWHIFDRTCGILSILLLRYRRRLTGRYHLLVPALRDLLKCLFYPPTRKHLNITPTTYPAKIAFLASLPQWLNPSDRTSDLTLPPSSTAKFSRLLQTLCDPSASAARNILKRRHNGGTPADFNLTDETRILRRQVSQHTQYLLQTYCQVTLDGYISTESKDKLMPGLHAILNASDIDLLRGINSGLNESQRAIWKDLYADWKKYGVWNQK